MAENYIDHSEFDLKKATNTGGVTGSRQVVKDNEFYQLKPSILNAKIIRRTKAGGMDRENFGELIAAAISKSLVKEKQNIELVPEVLLVYDKVHKKVLVASKYLKNVEGTLDHFATESKKIRLSGKHVKVSAEFDVGNNLNLSKDTILKQDLAQALALSILCGDHDVNPGNMLVVKDQQNYRIARIDFGHAFNDLLNAPQMFGGKVRNNDNLVLDFLNRDQVASFPSPGETKLWKNYQGVIPSQELVDAFNKLGKSDSLEQGLENAKKPFQELINDLSKDPKANEDVLDHIKNSLMAINNNISNKDKQIPANATIEYTLNNTFKNIGDFYKKNQEQMLNVAKLMDIQLKIDKVITAKKDAEKIDQSLISEIQETYNDLLTVKGIGDGKNLEWVKSSKNIAGFKGNLGEFVKRRALNLGVAVEGEIKDLGDFIQKKEISDPIIKEIVTESALVTNFLEQSVKTYAEIKKEEDAKLKDSQHVKKVVKSALEEWLKDLPKSEKWQELERENPQSYKAMQEISDKLKENLDSYVDIMDKKLTKERNKLLEDQKIDPEKAEPKELIEEMQKVSTDNIYTKMAKDVINKGHLLDNVGDTIWKSLSNFCSSIGLEKLGEFFKDKNKQAKMHIMAKKIGIASHAVEKISQNIQGIKRGLTETFSNDGKSNNKNKDHTH